MQKNKCVTSIKKTSRKSKLSKDLISVILLCDLPNYRMKSYGLTCLIDIDKQYKLIDYQISVIQKNFTNSEIIICAGFESDKLCKYITHKYNKKNVRIVENQIFDQTGPCESMRLALNNITNDKILVLDGNLIFDYTIFENFDTNLSSALLLDNISSDLEVCANTNELGNIEHFSYGGQKSWSEIIFLRGKDTVNTLRKIISSKDCKKKFVFEAFNELLKHKHNIRCETRKSKIRKINNIKTYHKIRKNNEIFD